MSACACCGLDPCVHLPVHVDRGPPRPVRSVKHGRDCPSKCSTCLGATARRVEQQAGSILIDGVPVRAIEPEVDPAVKQARVRGGRNGRRTR